MKKINKKTFKQLCLYLALVSIIFNSASPLISAYPYIALAQSEVVIANQSTQPEQQGDILPEAVSDYRTWEEAITDGLQNSEIENPVVYDDFKGDDAAKQCAVIGEYEHGYKIDNWKKKGMDGTYGGITILNSDGKTFDWNSTHGIDAVIVKAGTGANVWIYDPQETSDTGLYAYDNKDISHATFCWNGEKEEDGRIIVKKITDPENSEQAFDFKLSGPADMEKDFDLKNGDEWDSKDLSNGLIAGKYSVEEDEAAGWKLTDVSCDSSKDHDEEADDLDLQPGETITCTFTNTRETGKIVVDKVTNLAGDLQVFDFEVTGEGYEDFSLTDEDDPNEQVLATGIYSVDEVVPQDWEQTSVVCESSIQDETKGNIEDHTALELEADETITCTFTNTKIEDETRTIKGYKYEDLNGNGELDDGEGLLEDWRITLCKYIPWEESLQIRVLSENPCVDTLTNAQGKYEFKDLVPGIYKLIEEQKAYYTPTNPVSGEYDNVDTEALQRSYDFYNQPVSPQLTISKFNDSTGPENPGDMVRFTLVVKASGGPLKDVKVIDLPAEGFDFQSGSWEAWSSDSGRDVEADIMTNGSVTGYTSPGFWPIGNMADGEEITLTYLAKIHTSVDAGLYKDIAWTHGEDEWGGEVMGSAVAPGHLATNFVGTEVEVVARSLALNVEIDEDEETREVMGAAVLPATGAPTVILGFALSTLALGMFLILFSLRKKLLPVVPFLLLVVSPITGSVYAETLDPNIMVRIEEPAGKFNEPFNITFTAMDTKARNMTAKCLVDGPTTDWTEFASFSISPDGNSHTCKPTGAQLTTNGTYYFKVTVDADGGYAESATVSSEYNSSFPGKPKYIEVDRQSSCKYEIEFKTADDGQTSYVEIYMDDEKEFDADSSTRVRTISVGPNSKYEFDHTVAGGACAHRQYFAVRAFNSAGNGSKVEAEELVTVKTVIINEPSTSTENALVSSAGNTFSQEIIGGEDIDVILTGDETEGTGTTDSDSDDEGNVLGEGIDDEEGTVSKIATSPWTWIAVLLTAGGATLYIFRKR